MIDLQNIEVKFNVKKREVLAVDNVSLKIEKGDIYGIVGYSGAGKSTLVRVINYLQAPTAGKVIVDGQELGKLSAKEIRHARRKIGMIFQHFNLLDSLSIFDNVAFPLKYTGKSNEEIKAKVESLLELVGILDKKDAFPDQLSGGQKQRVAIARALANDPDILLCDEATSALDPKTTLSVLDLLRDINKQLGITMVVITHEMQVVKEICNKVAVMENGHVIESGSVVDIFNNPQQPLTIDFIRTATYIDQAEKNIVDHIEAPIYELNFVGEHTGDPVIIELYNQFGVIANIQYGNIEFLQGTPLGTLLVTLDGEFNFESVEEFLAEKSVTIKKLEVTK
jgi:D-methionine transport system ATP-binding protein